MLLLSLSTGLISGDSVTGVLPVRIQVTGLARAAVMIDQAPCLEELAGRHQPVLVEPDCLESLTTGAKCHDFYRLGDVFSLLDTGDHFVFD